MRNGKEMPGSVKRPREVVTYVSGWKVLSRFRGHWEGRPRRPQWWEGATEPRPRQSQWLRQASTERKGSEVRPWLAAPIPLSHPHLPAPPAPPPRPACGADGWFWLSPAGPACCSMLCSRRCCLGLGLASPLLRGPTARLAFAAAASQRSGRSHPKPSGSDNPG